MARYGIQSLNYVAAGAERAAVNLDTVVMYELSAVDHALAQDPASLSSPLAVEGGSAAVRAVLSGCSEETRRAISAFNAGRVRRGRSFVLEFGQAGQAENELGAGSAAVLPMYDAVDEAMKTAERKPRSTLPKLAEDVPTDDEYIPQLDRDPLQFCQVGERSYFLTGPTRKSFQNLRICVDPQADNGSEFYVARLSSNDAKTYLYPSLAELSAGSYGEYFKSDDQTISALQAKVDGFFQPAAEAGLEYNHLFGMLHGWKSRYESGNVYGDTYETKNMYDATYSMRAESRDELSRAREYEGMCANGGALYLKYRDDVSYRRSGGRWDRETPGGRAFQKIERFQPVKSQDLKNSRHKSNFFSVRLRGTGLGGDGGEAEAAARLEIENAVRRIAAALSPANTQLFEVEFKD